MTNEEKIMRKLEDSRRELREEKIMRKLKDSRRELRKAEEENFRLINDLDNIAIRTEADGRSEDGDVNIKSCYNIATNYRRRKQTRMRLEKEDAPRHADTYSPRLKLSYEGKEISFQEMDIIVEKAKKGEL